MKMYIRFTAIYIYTHMIDTSACFHMYMFRLVRKTLTFYNQYEEQHKLSIDLVFLNTFFF